ncbi:MAG: hypothetical protein AAF899_04155 [Pseudomonadota bacterium]
MAAITAASLLLAGCMGREGSARAVEASLMLDGQPVTAVTDYAKVHEGWMTWLTPDSGRLAGDDATRDSAIRLVESSMGPKVCRGKAMRRISDPEAKGLGAPSAIYKSDGRWLILTQCVAG